MFKSILFFISNIFLSRSYDVVFVYSNHFNRGIDGENEFLKPFLKSLEKGKYSYLLLEESDLKRAYSHYPRNTKAIPLDFITLIQVILRKVFTNKSRRYTIDEYSNYYEREKKVSKIIKGIFFRQFTAKVYITLAHNNSVLLREISPNAYLLDYQHGMIWHGHYSTLNEYAPHPLKVKNAIISMLYGEGFKNLLLEWDRSGFYTPENVIDIGFYRKVAPYKSRINSKKILYSLQNVDLDRVDEYYKMINGLLRANRAFLIGGGYSIYIKNHPRYDREDGFCLDMDYPNISILDDDFKLDTILDDISIHITSKSTMAFDMSLESIPTIFVDMFEPRSPRDMFISQYHYRLEELFITKKSDLREILLSLEDSKLYHNASVIVYEWVRHFYQDFDEEKFLALLQRRV